MSQTTTLTILERALWLIAELAGPIVLAALVVGVIISMIQAVTQVNEMTLSYVPKIIAIALVLVLAGPWMLQTLLNFTAQLFSDLPTLIG
jgi:flagellar biosynthesis protein FliQ